MTADQRRVLEAVAEIGNRLMRDGETRYGASARGIAHRFRWYGEEAGPSWDRRPVVQTHAAVNRLLGLRRRGLVTDVDGRWYTTDAGERELRNGGEIVHPT